MPDSPWSLAPGVTLGALTTLNALNYLGYVAAAMLPLILADLAISDTWRIALVAVRSRLRATGRQMAGEASEAVARRARTPPRFAWGTRRSLGTVRTPGCSATHPT